MIERCATHHHLSTDLHTLYFLECRDFFREILDLHSRDGHILSLDSTPTGDRLSQYTTAIHDSKSETIIFGLDIVVKLAFGRPVKGGSREVFS